MSYYSPSSVLGVMRGPDALYAVLMEETEEGPVVRFSIPPVRTGRDDYPSGLPSSEDVFGSDEATDVRIQFGDGGETTLGEGSGDEPGSFGGDPVSTATATDFLPALDAVLHECRERGYQNPDVAFCAPYDDVDTVELRVPAVATGTDESTYLPLERSALLELLERQYDGTVKSERVGFLPMSHGEEGEARVLAIVSRSMGSVPSTIDKMPDSTLLQSVSSLFFPAPVQLRETEVSIYFAWACLVLGADLSPDEKSLVVRVGTEDTLLLFMEEHSLHQVDTLPSLTAEDPPDTICSRVLLYQDEYGMGDVDNIFLIGEGNEGGLVDGFEPYFSRTDIQLLRDQIPFGGEQAWSGLYLASIGAALRAFEGSDRVFDIPAMDLSGSRKDSPSMDQSESLLFLAMFLLTGMALGWYALTNAQEIREQRAELQSLEKKTKTVTRDQLENRIDSLQSIVDRHTRHLRVRRQLLKGSNKWSRSLAKLASGVDEVQGLSVRQWTPQGSASVTIRGRAADRSRIIDFAEHVDGDIDRMATTEIREWSLYAYKMTVPLDTTKPAAVRHWQKTQGAKADTEGATRNKEGESTDPSPTNGEAPAHSGRVAAGERHPLLQEGRRKRRFGTRIDEFSLQRYVRQSAALHSESLASAHTPGNEFDRPLVDWHAPVRD